MLATSVPDPHANSLAHPCPRTKSDNYWSRAVGSATMESAHGGSWFGQAKTVKELPACCRAKRKPGDGYSFTGLPAAGKVSIDSF